MDVSCRHRCFGVGDCPCCRRNDNGWPILRLLTTFFEHGVVPSTCNPPYAARFPSRLIMSMSSRQLLFIRSYSYIYNEAHDRYVLPRKPPLQRSDCSSVGIAPRKAKHYICGNADANHAISRRRVRSSADMRIHSEIHLYIAVWEFLAKQGHEG